MADRSNEKKNKKEKKHRKGSMFVLLVLLFLICICALWLSGFDFGFGSGGSIGGNGENETLPEMSETPVSVSETVSETEAAEDDGLIVIEVSEGGITYKGEAVGDAAALKERILADMDDGVLFLLRDDHAVKALYDEVKAVLDETGAVYSVEQGEGQSEG